MLCSALFYVFCRIMLIIELIKKFNFCNVSIRAFNYFIGDRCCAAVAMQHNPDHRQFSMAGT